MTGLRFAPATAPVFDHLLAMTDDRGLFEHARYDAPRPEHGYCVDDAARALVVLSRQRTKDPKLRDLEQRYLDFVLAAVTSDGRCRNRMDEDGQWTDLPSTGDWWGRAVWGLGVAASTSASPLIRVKALQGFRVAAQQRSPHNRAMAFAAIGAGHLLQDEPGERSAIDLLQDCAEVVGAPGEGRDWPWPEPRLRYANASVPEALIIAGSVLHRPALLHRGLLLLNFLLDRQTRDGHLSVTPVAGRGHEWPVPEFDQQPIEVAALAEACATAYRITGDPHWGIGLSLAWAWFLGDNDSTVCMFDPATGAGFDGLEAGGRNQNQGAESTLAVLATAQLADRMRATR
ncbi:glycosyltransferase [uncultured Jatrophihabitans sp.]|uniref:glycosyltransferase n=1 Tax=uncultured Jatrophihabitans sp. TaxID=1610747 RepID=UPI0035CAA0CE